MMRDHWDQDELSRLAAEVCSGLDIPEFFGGVRTVEFIPHPVTGAPQPYLTAAAAMYLRHKYDVVVDVLEWPEGGVFKIFEPYHVLAVMVRATARSGPLEGKSIVEFGAVPFVNHTACSKECTRIGLVNANALMRAVTKANRRAVLRLCLDVLPDESELEGIVGSGGGVGEARPSPAPLEIPEEALEEFQE